MNRKEQGDSGYFRTGRANGGKPQKREVPPAPSQDAMSSEPVQERPRSLSRSRRIALVLLAGLCLTLVQLGVILMLSPVDEEAIGMGGMNEMKSRSASLVQHDSFWFRNIMIRGYVSTIPPAPNKSLEVSNVAFFPGYPLLAGFLKEHLNLSSRAALLWAAWMSAWLFWSYAVAFLMRWRTSPVVAVAVLAVVAAHPAAFYLVAAYSESLFLAMLLGFLFWSSREGKLSALLAAGHGFGMTATRIVGLPCAVASGGGGRVGGGPLQRLERRIWITFTASLGALLFFAFCQARFGSWDFYMQTQKAGWGVTPQYLEPLRWYHYIRFNPDWNTPREVSQFSMGATLVMVVLLGMMELWAARQARIRQITSGFRVRLPFYFCALVIFYISAAGVASVGFESMIRYQFCTWAVGLLPVAHLLTVVPPGGRWQRGALLVLAAFLIVVGWRLQGVYASVYTLGGWFA